MIEHDGITHPVGALPELTELGRQETQAMFEELAPDSIPPGDWDDVDPDYREEVCNELPVAFEDRLAAEKLLKRYHHLNAEEREAVQFVDDEIARLDEQREALTARRAELLKPIQRKREWLDSFRPLLESWAREALTYAKARSIKLTYGAVKFRKSPDRLEVTDEAAALFWARDYRPEAIRESINKSDLKAHIKETGEVVPGVELVAGEDTFSIEVE